MPETLTAPAAPAVVAPVTPEAPVAPLIADAGKNLKAATSWDQVVVETQPESAVPAINAEPETPAETPAAEAPAAPTFEGWTVDAEQRLHRPDGTYAEASEIDAYNADAERVNTSAPTETVAEPETPAPIVVTLKGRDGSDVEIEVTDEKVAEALRANAKDGLRLADYTRRRAEVDEYLAERRAFETMIETNPEALILQHLPEDKQEGLAVALVAKYWDKIAPTLLKFDTEPGARLAETATAQARIAQQSRDYDRLTAQQKYGVQLEHATRALIPEHADEASVDQFMADAGQDLMRAVQAKGAPIPIEEVKTVLQRRIALYGFDKSQAPGSESTPTPPKRPIARAVQRSQPSATATAPTVTATNGATVKAKVTAQKVAASVPTAGAGAASIRAPLIAPGSTIEQASQQLRKQKNW